MWLHWSGIEEKNTGQQIEETSRACAESTCYSDKHFGVGPVDLLSAPDR